VGRTPFPHLRDGAIKTPRRLGRDRSRRAEGKTVAFGSRTAGHRHRQPRLSLRCLASADSRIAARNRDEPQVGCFSKVACPLFSRSLTDRDDFTAIDAVELRGVVNRAGASHRYSQATRQRQWLVLPRGAIPAGQNRRRDRVRGSSLAIQHRHKQVA